MPPSKKSSSSHSSSSSSRRSSPGSTYRRSGGGGGNGCVTLLVAVPVIAIALFLFSSGGSTDANSLKEKLADLPQIISKVIDKNSGNAGNTGNQEANLSDKNEIFVEEIGRTCKWNSEYESYYDKTTDCYFWKNDTIDPPQWQYWYEDVSSDYGDYGWMEYDFDEKIWYIEVSEGKWDPLPDKYDTTELWHFSTSG